MKKAKRITNPFEIRMLEQDRVIEVWLGEPGHPESEYVLTIARLYIPQLIAALRSKQEARKQS